MPELEFKVELSARSEQQARKALLDPKIDLAMLTDKGGSPGSHPHADRRNWQPATTYEEYARNVREGLEPLSERRLAKLGGFSRMSLYRVKLAAELPKAVIEALDAVGVHSTRALAQIALALKRDTPLAKDVERCPHCGAVLRRRPYVVNSKVFKAVVEAFNRAGPDGETSPGPS